DTAVGVNQPPGRIGFDLFSKQVDEGVYGVFFNFATMAPEGVLNGLARNDAARISREKLQKPKFGHGEEDLAAVQKSAKSRDVQNQTINLEDISGFRNRAAPQSAHAREKFRKRKRLCEVIVGAGIKALHNVRQCIARGKHQDGDIFLTQSKTA